MTQQDYYHVLGVDQKADEKTIKEAYRTLAFRYHPDRNEKDPSSVEMMKRVNEAYAVLSDEKKRKDYDEMRTRFGENAYGQFRGTYTEQDIFRGSDVQQIFEEMARSFGLRGVDAIFGDFYGNSYNHFSFTSHGLHGKGFIYRGRPGHGGFRRGGRGPGKIGGGIFGKFDGRSSAGGQQLGMGKFAQYLISKVIGRSLPQKGEDIHDTIYLSSEFANAGGPYPYHHRRRSKKLVVNIPTGTREGQQIRLSEMGMQGKNGGPNGDLYLKIRFNKNLLKKAKELFVSAIGG